MCNKGRKIENKMRQRECVDVIERERKRESPWVCVGVCVCVCVCCVCRRERVLEYRSGLLGIREI